MAIDCPFGSSDCPKLRRLEKMVEQNGQELAELRKQVHSVNTTLKNVSYLISTIITILVAIIGVIEL